MEENSAVKVHRKIIMARRVQKISEGISSLLPESAVSILDVGAGTGELAMAVKELRPEVEVSGVDVYVRPKTFIPVKKYDGGLLPFHDCSFDTVMTVDVLHHCSDPIAVLKECSRVSREWVIIKDHIADSYFDNVKLRFMDWVGNRAHGVALPYNYFSTVQWQNAFREAGLISIKNIAELNIYPLPLNVIFGGSLHCLHLLKKV
jgi:SAM-dependent methyltransferase